MAASFQASICWHTRTSADKRRCVSSPNQVIGITTVSPAARRFRYRMHRTEPVMPNPYGLTIIDNCLTCPVREEHLFCNLSGVATQKLNEIKSTAVYPKSAMLFIEGQQPRGVFVLCTGKVKLYTSSRQGKTIITKISQPGDVLGLNASISNRPYEVTAEMTEAGQANFITRDGLSAVSAGTRRSCSPGCGATQQKLLHGVRRDSHIRFNQFTIREVCQVAYAMDCGKQKFGSSRPIPPHADARGDCGDDRHQPGNGEPLVLRLQKKTAGSTEGFGAGDSRQTCAGENDPVLIERLAGFPTALLSADFPLHTAIVDP